MNSDSTFYWFDYETFGTHPAWDRPCQFAGIRTDMDLNVIGDPLVIYCKQALDYLPHPAACKVTGITPALANEKGYIEADFIKQILEQIGKPGTCSVGYNSIRFDDEFTRHTLFRNFLDPYEHEWKDGNSRWDLLDIVRLTRALRPKGINWPINEDGSASNRLEHLSVANGIEHSQAHDAMSDVWATIGMARLIKDTQPRLFEYAFNHRSKHAVSQLLNTRERKACLQVSGMIPGRRHHIAPILPLAQHPDNANSVIVLDLHTNPTELGKLSADEISRRVYQSADSDTHDSFPRPGLRTVQINKCPVIVPMATLRQVDAERLEIDQAKISEHLEIAQSLLDGIPMENIKTAMSRRWPDEPVDVDGSLYAGTFLSQADKQRLTLIRQCNPQMLSEHAGFFDDERLDEMLWRYQARNYPESLSAEQSEQWFEHCKDKLSDESAPWLGFAEFERVMTETNWKNTETDVRQSLADYVSSIQQQVSSS
ncbi:MAG: exodeoxyribonuclease I [Granulosicoccus sp.]